MLNIVIFILPDCAPNCHSPQKNFSPATEEKHGFLVGNYLTAPATAFVKLFCSRKKMMMVGREHSVTPAITTP